MKMATSTSAKTGRRRKMMKRKIDREKRFNNGIPNRVLDLDMPFPSKDPDERKKRGYKVGDADRK